MAFTFSNYAHVSDIMQCTSVGTKLGQHAIVVDAGHSMAHNEASCFLLLFDAEDEDKFDAVLSALSSGEAMSAATLEAYNAAHALRRSVRKGNVNRVSKQWRKLGVGPTEVETEEAADLFVGQTLGPVSVPLFEDNTFHGNVTLHDAKILAIEQSGVDIEGSYDGSRVTARLLYDIAKTAAAPEPARTPAANTRSLSVKIDNRIEEAGYAVAALRCLKETKACDAGEIDLYELIHVAGAAGIPVPADLVRATASSVQVELSAGLIVCALNDMIALTASPSTAWPAASGAEMGRKIKAASRGAEILRNGEPCSTLVDLLLSHLDAVEHEKFLFATVDLTTKQHALAFAKNNLTVARASLESWMAKSKLNTHELIKAAGAKLVRFNGAWNANGPVEKMQELLVLLFEASPASPEKSTRPKEKSERERSVTPPPVFNILSQAPSDLGEDDASVISALSVDAKLLAEDPHQMELLGRLSALQKRSESANQDDRARELRATIAQIEREAPALHRLVSAPVGTKQFATALNSKGQLAHAARAHPPLGYPDPGGVCTHALAPERDELRPSTHSHRLGSFRAWWPVRLVGRHNFPPLRPSAELPRESGVVPFVADALLLRHALDLCVLAVATTHAGADLPTAVLLDNVRGAIDTSTALKVYDTESPSPELRSVLGALRAGRLDKVRWFNLLDNGSTDTGTAASPLKALRGCSKDHAKAQLASAFGKANRVIAHCRPRDAPMAIDWLPQLYDKIEEMLDCGCDWSTIDKIFADVMRAASAGARRFHVGEGGISGASYDEKIFAAGTKIGAEINKEQLKAIASGKDKEPDKKRQRPGPNGDGGDKPDKQAPQPKKPLRHSSVTAGTDVPFPGPTHADALALNTKYPPKQIAKKVGQGTREQKVCWNYLNPQGCKHGKQCSFFHPT